MALLAAAALGAAAVGGIDGANAWHAPRSAAAAQSDDSAPDGLIWD